MKTALLFPGQGAQYLGMGSDFYEEYQSCRDIYDRFPEIRDLCFNGPEEKLNDTEFAQSAILLTSLAISNVLKDKISIDYVAGLSLGEYSALTFANSFSLEDAVEIVKARGTIMADALPKGTSSMAAVLGGDDELIDSICNSVNEMGICEIANYNCPGQTVISGEVDAVNEATRLLKEAGIRRVVPLNVSGAFHCSLLDDASFELGEVLNKYPIRKPEIALVYNALGKNSDEDIIEILMRQIKSSVYFKQSIEYMIGQGVDTFIEIGPGKTLSAFVKKTNRNVIAHSLNSVDVMREFLEGNHVK